MYEYSGNMHIHSSYSDGSLGISEIAEMASDIGLDFIIITDHYTLGGLNDHLEGYHDRVLVLFGMEANENKNHYLCLNIDKEVKNDTEHPQVVINEVNRQHGIGIIAHPFEKGSPLFMDGISFEWTDWNVYGFQGIEIWNYTSQWKDYITSIMKGILCIFYPHIALKGPCLEAMKKLDEYQYQGKKIIATGGSDAHGYHMKLGLLRVEASPYETLFKSINIHVISESSMSGESKKDKEIIYNAIRKGSLWIGYDYFKNSRGFSFEIKKGGCIWKMGESVPFQKNLMAVIHTPYKARVKLIRNGKEYRESIGRQHCFDNLQSGGFDNLQSGVYRVEAYHWHLLGYRFWIFSNSIWVE